MADWLLWITIIGCAVGKSGHEKRKPPIDFATRNLLYGREIRQIPV
jgi:hypothetical protein